MTQSSNLAQAPGLVSSRARPQWQAPSTHLPARGSGGSTHTSPGRASCRGSSARARSPCVATGPVSRRSASCRSGTAGGP
eukprot:366345-Chlamydomonas_euryale.AAC.13